MLGLPLGCCEPVTLQYQKLSCKTHTLRHVGHVRQMRIISTVACLWVLGFAVKRLCDTYLSNLQNILLP